MAAGLAVHVVRSTLERIAYRTRIVVLGAPAYVPDPGVPDGFDLIRIAGSNHGEDRALIETAMRVAGEPDGLVAPRLAGSDEFFALLSGGQAASFGWVTFSDRVIGPFTLGHGPGRGFLYNFHTLQAFRGRGLYPRLLNLMRHALGASASEFVIDVDDHNDASVKGIRRAGFQPIETLTFLTFFRHWQYPIGRSVWHATTPSGLDLPISATKNAAHHA